VFTPLRTDTNGNERQHPFWHFHPACHRVRTRVLSHCDAPFEGLVVAIREGRRQAATVCRDHRRPRGRHELFVLLDFGVGLVLAAGAAYLLFRDAIRGQSVGKFLLGLVVISLETGRPSSLAGSVRRNLLLLLPGANVVAIFLEVRTIVRDPQGQRLGDRLAQTQVVEGLGAKDLVKSFQDWLMDLVAELDRDLGRRGRAPERIDRAA
jgi:hypothetical protein